MIFVETMSIRVTMVTTIVLFYKYINIFLLTDGGVTPVTHRM